MYNSAFYKSLSTNDYDIVFAQESFLDGVLTYNRTWDMSQTVNLANLQRNVTTDTGHHYERLDLASCIDAYATDFLDQRRNLVFILSSGNETIKASNLSIYDIHYYKYDVGDYIWDEFTVDWGTDDPYNWFASLPCMLHCRSDVFQDM